MKGTIMDCFQVEELQMESDEGTSYGRLKDDD